MSSVCSFIIVSTDTPASCFNRLPSVNEIDSLGGEHARSSPKFPLCNQTFLRFQSRCVIGGFLAFCQGHSAFEGAGPVALSSLTGKSKGLISLSLKGILYKTLVQLSNRTPVLGWPRPPGHRACAGVWLIHPVITSPYFVLLLF